MRCREAAATGKSNERSLRYLPGSRQERRYAGCGWWKPFSPINDSGMADEELVTSNPPPAGGPADAPDETVEAAVADDYSDAERDEVAARLASLGYIDE
jgi:hypothetical protein